MENILHILNGDSTLRGFEESGLDGDVMIWREVLSEGPVEENISSGSFWRKRQEWIDKAFGETQDGYEGKVISELSKLSEPYSEFNLWFDFDLHCQVNMLGVLMMLNKHTDLSSPAIYLICPDSFPGIDDFRGMGQLDGDELDYLYDNIRVQLGEPDFVVAAEAWQLYTKHNLAALNKWLNETHYWGNLHYLNPAMQAHAKRLEINANGLNYVEQKLLDIYNSGVHNKIAIYQNFWNAEPIYGMSDREIDIYLDKVVPELR